MAAFSARRSKKLVARSILCAILLLSQQLANAALAAPSSAIDNVLNDVIAQVQEMMRAMSQGCSGGPSGVPPVSWGGLQQRGDVVVKALGDLRVAVQSGQTSNAAQQIDSIVGGV